MKPFLTIKSLSYYEPRSERYLVENVDLSLNAGDFLILLGGNGSGKSSLIKLINGLYRPSHGDIALDGRHGFQKQSLEARASILSTLTQDPHMTTFDDLTVLENAVFYAMRRESLFKDMLFHKARTYLKDYLASFHPRFVERFDQPVQKLSGGERQLLALALCFLHPPRLLLLDEHTSALDPKASSWVMQKTLEQIEKHKITVIMTTHKIEHALTYGNGLVVLKEGRLVKRASIDEKSALTFDDIIRFYDL
ncbi:MAG: ATP-binding cassette domain-containing protein [Candidatus Nucleicultricaceae bacterium]